MKKILVIIMSIAILAFAGSAFAGNGQQAAQPSSHNEATQKNQAAFQAIKTKAALLIRNQQELNKLKIRARKETNDIQKLVREKSQGQLTLTTAQAEELKACLTRLQQAQTQLQTQAKNLGQAKARLQKHKKNAHTNLFLQELETINKTQSGQIKALQETLKELSALKAALS